MPAHHAWLQELDDFDADHVPRHLFDHLNQARREVIRARSEICAARLQALDKEPLCPDCGVPALAQACHEGRSSGCPRHMVVEAYGGDDALRRKFRG